jgi:hypothetical protein
VARKTAPASLSRPMPLVGRAEIFKLRMSPPPWWRIEADQHGTGEPGEPGGTMDRGGTKNGVM